MLGAGVTELGDGLVILGTTLGCAVLVDDPGTDGDPAGMLLCTPEPDRWVRVMPAMVGTPSLEWILGVTGLRREELDAALAADRTWCSGAWLSSRTWRLLGSARRSSIPTRGVR